MQTLLLSIIIILLILVVILLFVLRTKGNGTGFQDLQLQNRDIQSNLGKIEQNLKEDFRINREENARISQDNRSELSNTLKEFNAEQRNKFDELKREQKELTAKTGEQLDKITGKVEEKLNLLNEQAKADNKEMRGSLETAFKGFRETFEKNVESFNNLQREKFSQLEEKQTKLVESTEKKLEEMRLTVDEKLQKTLNERLGQSFELVGKQLESVQKGLGEMQTIAADVGVHGPGDRQARGSEHLRLHERPDAAGSPGLPGGHARQLRPERRGTD